MEDIYHGNSKLGIVSQCDQIVNGLPPFSGMFEQRSDLVTGTTAVMVTNLVLKTEYSRIDTPFVLGREITKSILERTTFKVDSALVKGKTLFYMANSALRCIRKALAILPTLDAVQSIDDEGIHCRSGMTLNDVREQLLDAMFTLLRGKKSLDDEIEDDSGADASDESNEVTTPTRNPC
jgi:hypothetical protein